MADIWIPGWTRKDLGPDGGTFDEVKHPKGCIHTTEGSTLAGAEAAYGRYPPHLGYDPAKRTKHQYVALNRCSYAFRSGESDDEYIIQVELVGFAGRSHLWPNAYYRYIAEDVLKPLEDLVGIPRQHLRFYRSNEGIVLASKRSPIRLRPTSLRNYSGWIGHQHVPGLADNGALLTDGDEHWDPGGFLMDLAISFMPSNAPTTPMSEEEEMAKVFFVHGDSTTKVPGKNYNYGDALFMCVSDADGTRRRHMHPDEWACLAADGAKAHERPQRFVDSIPWGAQPGLDPWVTGGPVPGTP